MSHLFNMPQIQEQSPFEEQLQSSRYLDPCILVIFGATGDLTSRKLIPALYNLIREGQLPSHFACVAFARREKTNEQFREEMYSAVSSFSRSKPIDQELWKNFREQIFYHQSNFDDDNGYKKLGAFLEELDRIYGTKGNRVYYLSTPPSYFPTIVEKLGSNKLIYDSAESQSPWSRVIIEKPFGHDLKSAKELQTNITRYLREDQIYRIDHWLGKETVQNILVLRFSNIFESIWNSHFIDHVQITVSEDLGVGTRGKFWEEAGMMRDIVQNHMMQLLSLIAMEPPVNMKANSIRNEKVKVLESIRPIPLENIDQHVIRGQYGPGYINAEPVKGYRQEENVDEKSHVETYVALKLFIDNWRWLNVPFFLRAGKRLPKKATEVAVFFKSTPNVLFQSGHLNEDQNVLVIRIQPDEGLSLRINSKVPGMGGLIQPVKLDFRYGSYFGAAPPEAYERLICDCILGDSTLFAREDEVLYSWKLLSDVIHHWTDVAPKDFPNYAAGTWGPSAADKLIADHNRRWRFM